MPIPQCNHPKKLNRARPTRARPSQPLEAPRAGLDLRVRERPNGAPLQHSNLHRQSAVWPFARQGCSTQRRPQEHGGPSNRRPCATSTSTPQVHAANRAEHTVQQACPRARGGHEPRACVQKKWAAFDPPAMRKQLPRTHVGQPAEPGRGSQLAVHILPYPMRGGKQALAPPTHFR